MHRNRKKALHLLRSSRGQMRSLERLIECDGSIDEARHLVLSIEGSIKKANNLHILIRIEKSPDEAESLVKYLES